MESKVAYFIVLFVFIFTTTLAIPGGWSPADVNDATVRDIARRAVEELDKLSNSLYRSTLVDILDAETQVVAGINYRLTLRLGILDCKKNEPLKDPGLCTIKRTQICKLTMWVQVWRGSYQLSRDSKCKYETKEDNRARRSPLVGGQRAVDVASLDVKDAALFITQHLSSQSNGLYSMDFHEIIEGTQQVVSGVMYRLKLALILSSCDKPADGSQPLLETCKDDPHKSMVECYVEVQDQPWLTPRHTLHLHHCQPTVQLSDHSLYFKPHQNSPNLLGGDGHDVGHIGEFEEFKQKYNKVYGSAEEEGKRYEIFRSNMRIAKQIEFYDLGDAKYGASPFADMTPEEFRSTYLPRRWDQSHDESLKPATIPSDTPPDQFDWRDHEAVTPVKNQGSCGSCWAFSVTGNIEGQWALKKKKLLSLSEQELVDCDKLDEGCNGGLPSLAYQEIQRLGGLETETDYPYKGADEKCNFVPGSVRVYVNGSVNISKDENEMKSWIYKNGPVSIGINAFAMQFYLGGISHPWKVFCAPDYLDHGVAIVGYAINKGIFGTTPYWIVKNSWGPHWGEKGYYLVYRGAGVCGLNTMVSSATID